jgi:tripartite-type tricarboxylate transporter receptor subunit TctC
VPAKSVKELVALAKKAKGKMAAASNGAGTTSSLAVEMLKQMAGVDVIHVPYKGGGPSITALISGETDMLFATGPAAAPFIKQGKVRALAVTTPKRASALSDLPTMTSIYPGFESDNWYAMFFPKGTPRPMIDKMNSEIKKALDASDVKEFMKREVLDPVGSTPEELTAYFRKEIAKYAKVIKAGNITVQ